MSDQPLDPHIILAEYDLDPIQAIEEGGGTAGKTWKVFTSGGDYFLRMRGVRTSAESRLHFDHGLRQHLMDHEVPTAVALRNREGDLWMRREGRVFELYPWVVGRVFNAHSARELVNSACGLARFHQVARSFTPPSVELDPIAQYTALGFFDDASDRQDDPVLQRRCLREVRTWASSAEEEAVVDRVLRRVDDLERDYSGAAFERLLGWITHGDYTPANLLFDDGGELVGIFDLDWSFPGPRCRDVGEALYFFATQPREIDGGNIWSLTGTAEFDFERCRDFLRAYQEVEPLAPHELDATPLAFAGIWISIRLEGMAKVDPEDRFRFFSREVEKPLRWLDENWDAVRA